MKMKAESIRHCKRRKESSLSVSSDGQGGGTSVVKTAQIPVLFFDRPGPGRSRRDGQAKSLKW